MKKKKIIFISLASFLLVAAIVVTVLVLLNQEDNSEILPPPTELEVVKLSRPQGVKREGSVISWDEVANSSGYIVKVNDLEIVTDTNSCDISNVVSEGATLAVYAVGELNYKNSIMVKLTPYITVKNQGKIDSLNDKLNNLYLNSIDVPLTDEASKIIAGGAEELYFLGVTDECFDVLENIIEEMDILFEKDSASEIFKTLINILGDFNKEFDNEAILTKGIFKIIETYCGVFVELNDTEANKLLMNSLLNPHYEVNSVELCKKALTYIEALDLYKYESCQVLIGYLSKYFYALEQQLPGILDILLSLEDSDDDFVKSDIDMIFDAFTLKDEIITTLIDDMPTYNDYFSIYNVLSNGFESCCPEYLKEGNPFKLLLEDLEQLYLDNHYMLSFIKYLDADFVNSIKAAVDSVTSKINYEKINELKTYYKTGNYLFLAMKISELACTKDGKIDFVKAANLQAFLYQILMDLSSGDQELFSWIETLIKNNLDEASSKLMYEDIINDELLELIINIISLNEDATTDEVFEAISLSKYFKLKDNKTTEELETALKNISQEQINEITSLSFDEFSVTQVLVILGLNDILEVNIEGYIEYLKKIFGDIVDLMEYLSSVESISQIMNDLNVSEAFSTFIGGIGDDLVEKYPVLADSSEYLMNLLSGLGIDIVNIALKYEEIDTLLFNKEINFKYIYKQPTITESNVPDDYQETVFKKFSLYVIFGHRASVVEKDVDSLVELLEYYYNLIDSNLLTEEEWKQLFEDISNRLDNPSNINELIDNLLNMSDEELNELFDYILEEYDELFGFLDEFDIEKLENLIDRLIKQLDDEYKDQLDEFFDYVFDEIISVSFEKRLDDLRNYLINNRVQLDDLFDLYKTGLDFSNVEFDKIKEYFEDFKTTVNFDDYSFDEFVEEYKTNSIYQALVDDAFDMMLQSSSDSIVLVIDEFLKLEEEVILLPDVSQDILNTFDSLEEIKSNVEDYNNFKESVVSLIEDLYYQFK